MKILHYAATVVLVFTTTIEAQPLRKRYAEDWVERTPATPAAEAVPPLLRDNSIRRVSWRGAFRSGESAGRNSSQRRSARTPWWSDNAAGGNPGRRKQHPPEDRGIEVDAQDFEIIISGYVFVAQEYIAPPYRLRVEEQQLLVNDRELLLPALPEPEGDEIGMSPSARWARQIARDLQRGSVVVVSNDVAQPDVSFLPRFENGYPILQYVAGVNLDQLDEIARKSPSAAWLANYDPPPALITRAKKEIEQIELARSSIHATAPPARMGYWAYPLTAGGMFLVAVAIGQLCVSRSLLTSDRGRVSPDASRLAQRCILFIVGLSLLDLVCTVVALQTNSMHELNPLATLFLSQPAALIAFKLAVTLLGAGLLYRLRSHFPARRAAWWLCLVCTLVVVRWVTFHSLFVA